MAVIPAPSATRSNPGVSLGGSQSSAGAPVNGVQDWQGALASYAILLLIGESETWGPVAVALAWAIAGGLVLSLAENFKNLKVGA